MESKDCDASIQIRADEILKMRGTEGILECNPEIELQQTAGLCPLDQIVPSRDRRVCRRVCCEIHIISNVYEDLKCENDLVRI